MDCYLVVINQEVNLWNSLCRSQTRTDSIIGIIRVWCYAVVNKSFLTMPCEFSFTCEVNI
jgi:hypothetical protein